MNEDLQKIFEGMELSEDFKKKFEEIYNARIEEDTKQIKEAADQEAEEKYSAISEDYAQYVVSEMEEKTEAYINEEVVPTVEAYVDYVSKEFMTENKLVIESEAKVELADKFLSGFSQIAEQYNVTVPKGQDDVVSRLEAKLNEANAEMSKLMDKNSKLEETLVEGKKLRLAEAVSTDMTETTRERFVESASRVKYIDEGQFESALQELKESFSPDQDKGKDKLNESQNEEGLKETTSHTDSWLDSVLSKV